MSGPFFNFENIENILGLVLGAVFFFLIDFVLYYLLKRKALVIVASTIEVLLFLGWGFNLSPLLYASIIALITFLTVCFSVEANKVKTVFGEMSEKGFSLKKAKVKPEALFDREEVYSKVIDAVISLSKQKTGALITFEKKDKLDRFVKSGTILNSPIVPELIQTIFYEGTRLHDGAVVIRDNLIHAASVYYTPTTRPLTGKYGSRHRAAIGISETTDSVTIIVSEETGRISIAYDGELQTVGPDILLKSFMEFMAMEKEKAPENEETER